MSSSRAHLDPRSPFVLDTRELGRRPGAMKRLTFGAPTPASYGVGTVTVPQGSELELDLRLESVIDGVLVSGTVSAPVVGECGRCLEPLTERVEADVQELFVYPEEQAPDDDEDVSRMDGDLLDVEPVVRDAVVLGLPMTPLCQDDCPGLCPVCGERLVVGAPAHSHDAPIDPRWAALQDRFADPHDPSADAPAEPTEKEK